MSENPLKVLSMVSAVFAGVVVLVTVGFFGWWAMKERLVFGDRSFDPVRWMAPVSAQTSSCERGDMVLDIQHRLLSPGMTRSEVTMLLGRPAWEEPDQIEYELGVCLWAVHGLRLYFDANERLVHSAIVQH